MRRKPNYSSETGFRARIISVICDTYLVMHGRVYSIPSVPVRHLEGFHYLKETQNPQQQMHAGLILSDCRRLVKILGFIDEAMVDAELMRTVHNSTLPVMGVSEFEYVKSLRRFLKALKSFEKQIPADEFYLITASIQKFIDEYDSRPYQQIIELGLRDETVRYAVSEICKTEMNPRRVIHLLARHEDPTVRLFVAEHRDCIDSNVQKLLATDANPRVRAEASWTPECFRSILEEQIRNGEALPDGCNPGNKNFNHKKQLELDRQLYEALYNEKPNDMRKHAISAAEYRKHLKLYSFAVFRVQKCYFKWYSINCYTTVRELLKQIYGKVWWIC